MLVDSYGNPIGKPPAKTEWTKVAEIAVLALTILSLAFAVSNSALSIHRTVVAPTPQTGQESPSQQDRSPDDQGADEDEKGSFENNKEHAGEVITCDLPHDQMIKNIGSKVDGAGMCVMSSIEMAARWAGLEQFRGLRDWCAKAPGGAYPTKVDNQITEFCKEKGIETVPHVQYEGPDPTKILDMADRNGWITGVTYGYSPRYGSTIAHMTCCIKFNGKYAVILDNNFVDKDDTKRYEWMSKEECVRRIKKNGGGAWVFVWCANGAPPPPSN